MPFNAQLLGEIQSFVSQLAYDCDLGTVADYMGHLTHDACWSVTTRDGTQRISHRAEVEAGVVARRGEGRQGPGTAMRHLVTAVDVHDNFDGTVQAVSYFVFIRQSDDDPDPVSMGHYLDTLRWESGQWRIASRRVLPG